MRVFAHPLPPHLRGPSINSEIGAIFGVAVVYALTAFDRDGAEADYTIALPSELAPKPGSLNYVQADAASARTARISPTLTYGCSSPSDCVSKMTLPEKEGQMTQVSPPGKRGCAFL